MEDKIRVLILEDEPSDAEMAQREINKSLASCVYKIVDNEADFLDALKNYAPNVIISDYNLPGFDGLAALRLAQQHTPLIPFIIFTGSQNEDIAVGCMKAGATDYVIKEYVKRLGSAVVQALDKMKVLCKKLQIEQELAESEKKYRSIFESIQDVYYETTIDGTIIELSPSVIMTSYTREELLGKNMLDFYSNPEERKALVQILFVDGHVVDYEVKLQDKNGRIMDVSVTAQLITSDDGSKRIAGTLRDISERTRFRQELVIAKEKAEEMNRLKSFFLANMSHELRTPLSGILGFSELLTTITTDTESHEMVQLIHTSGKRLLSTLNSILDLSRIEANNAEIHWQMIDLQYYFKDKIRKYERMAASRNLDLDYINNCPGISLKSDTNMFDHVIDAVVENALKFTEYGKVSIEIDRLVQEDKKWITIKVIDTGIGIEPDKIEIIFEPFRQVSEGYSRSYEGTGLGLTLAAKFTELLGGEISLEQTSAEGSTFLLKFPDLPVEEAEFSEQNQVLKTKEEALKDDFLILPKLLLVDDDEVTRIMVQLMLKNVYDIEFASTGKEALMMIDETQYQIILLDINLKENISGIDIIRLLRKSPRYATTPIVAATAYTMLGDKEKFLAEGFTEYLPKPFSKDDLIKIIQLAETLL